jgi:hypothetical protein
MTARERLNDRPAPLRPSRRRAPARTAKVRSYSDITSHDKPPKMQNKPAFHFAATRNRPASPSLLPDNPSSVD